MNSRGFTLLELLIAITMLALITAILGGALYMAHRTLDKGEKKIHYLERKKISFSLVESQIQSSFLYQFKDEEGQKKIFFSGSKDKLMFASNYSLWRGTEGNVFVTYTINVNEREIQFLKITEQTIGMEAKDEAMLFEDCAGISFEYYLKNAFEEGKWVGEWPGDEKGMPEKIKININCNAGKTTIIVNSFVKPTTALATSTAIPKQ